MAIHDKNDNSNKPSDGMTSVEMLSGLTSILMQELVDAGVNPQEIFEKGLFNEGYPVTPSLEKINKLSENSKQAMDSIAKKAIEPVIEQIKQKEQKMEAHPEQPTGTEPKTDHAEAEPETINQNTVEESVFATKLVNAYNTIATGAQTFAELFKSVPKAEAMAA